MDERLATTCLLQRELVDWAGKMLMGRSWDFRCPFCFLRVDTPLNSYFLLDNNHGGTIERSEQRGFGGLGACPHEWSLAM